MPGKRQGARQGMGQVDVWRQCRGGGGGIVRGGGRGCGLGGSFVKICDQIRWGGVFEK